MFSDRKETRPYPELGEYEEEPERHGMSWGKGDEISKIKRGSGVLAPWVKVLAVNTDNLS